MFKTSCLRLTRLRAECVQHSVIGYSSFIRHCDIRHSSFPRRGAVLLEVLVSLGLLVFGLAVVGMQINKGLEAARLAEIGTKAVMLADSKMAELLSGVIQPETNNDEIHGDFGMAYPGYTWRFRFQPTEVDGFLMVTLEIGYSPLQAKDQMERPDQDLEIDDPGVTIVETAYRLIPIPADVNLERDFGLTQEELAKLSEIIGGGGLGAEGAAGDVPEGGQGATGAGGLGGQDMSQLGSLMDLLQPLLAGGNFDPRMLATLPPDTLMQLQPLLEGLLGRGNVGAQAPPVMGGGRGGGRGRDGARGGFERRGPGRDTGRDGAGGRRGGRNQDDDESGGRGRDTDDARDEGDGGRGGRDGRGADDERSPRGGGRGGSRTTR